MCGNPHFVHTDTRVVLANKTDQAETKATNHTPPAAAAVKASFTCVIYYSAGRMGFICTIRVLSSLSLSLSTLGQDSEFQVWPLPHARVRLRLSLGISGGCRRSRIRI